MNADFHDSNSIKNAKRIEIKSENQRSAQLSSVAIPIEEGPQ